jgi:methylenetetrahydrofolate reductase (NADPH)
VTVGRTLTTDSRFADGDLSQRIAELAREASVEVTAGDEKIVPELASLLLPGAVVYVAHPPKATLDDVVRVSVAVQRTGLPACPHIVARRIADRAELQAACERLRDAGIDRALVIAGDSARAAGEFASSIDVLKSDLLTSHGIRSIGVAGHPEGHRSIGQSVLWRALLEKQALAKKRAIDLHIVTQFGFDPAAVADWDRVLPEHGITLPVHVGMAGPASLPQLINYAMQCGVAVSIRGALQGMSAMRNIAGLATSPDQMLTSIAQHVGRGPTRIVALHFYSFGGALATARWLRAVASARFELSATGAGFKTTD